MINTPIPTNASECDELLIALAKKKGEVLDNIQASIDVLSKDKDTIRATHENQIATEYAPIDVRISALSDKKIATELEFNTEIARIQSEKLALLPAVTYTE